MRTAIDCEPTNPLGYGLLARSILRIEGMGRVLEAKKQEVLAAVDAMISFAPVNMLAKFDC